MAYKKPFISFIIKKKQNWFILFLTGVWLIVWFGIFTTVLYGLATDTDKLDEEIVIFTTFFFIAAIFVFKIFLWHLRGKEKIVLNDNELKIEKLGTIFTFSQKYELHLIENLSLTSIPTTPLWIRIWGLGGGQIKFEYLGQNKYFGQSLNREEASVIIKDLNNFQKDYTNSQNIHN